MLNGTTKQYSYFPEEIQAKLIAVAAADWQRLPETVADTHLADTRNFEAVASDIARASVKPYLGALGELSIDREAVQLLTEILTQLDGWSNKVNHGSMDFFLDQSSQESGRIARLVQRYTRFW